MLHKIMKSIVIISILFLSSTLFASNATFLVRGPAQGELYLGTPCYSTYDGYEQHTYYGIFHSFDNGEHIELQYFSEDSDTAAFYIVIPRLVSDATPGVIYCRTSDYKLWISYDYGETWEFREQYGGSMYMSGCVEGEIYRRYDGLYISDDYGLTFELLIDYIDIVTEIGVMPGELYGIKSLEPGGWVPFGVYYCEDYGADFTLQCILDSTIAPNKLSRGTEPGEVYMIDYSPYGNYFIYRSIDYGQTFELKYLFPSIPVTEWSTHYTAGTQPGSFYFIKYRWVWAYSHSKDDVIAYVEMYIYYSDDYAETFSEVYYHSLNPDTTSVDENEVNVISSIDLMNYPNPFSSSTMISFSATDLNRLSQIKIYNIKGQLVKQYSIINNQSPIEWDGKNEDGKEVPNGVYLYKLSDGNKTLAINKMIKIN